MSDPQKAVIIGAGPAGLTAAYELTRHNIPVTVLERDNIVGGLARTERYKGYGYDIGGHRFYTKMEPVNRLWHEMLGPEFIRVPRLSRIHYAGKFLHYPLRLGNVLQTLGLNESSWMFLSFLHAQVQPNHPEESFEAYVTNRFGKRLYNAFFKSYTEKVWGIPCTEIRAEWAAQRIRGLSFTSVVRNALFKGGNEIKSLIEEFEYPVQGPGMMWNAFKHCVEAQGGDIWLDAPVVRVTRDGRRVTGVVVHHEGMDLTVTGTDYISTMALRDLMRAFDPPPPPEVLHAAEQLKYRDFLTVVLIVKQPDLFPDNWIYIHTPEVKVGRIQNFKNWSRAMLPDQSTSSLGMEYFVSEGDELWNMRDEDLVEQAKRELEVIGIARASDVIDGTVKRMEKAYPVYDSGYRDYHQVVREYIESLENLQTIGRNGMHKYNNQDHSMMTGLLAARNILGESNDLWAVNTDMEYQEEIQVPADNVKGNGHKGKGREQEFTPVPSRENL